MAHIGHHGYRNKRGHMDSIVKCVCILHSTVIVKDGFQQNVNEISVRSILCQNSGDRKMKQNLFKAFLLRTLHTIL